jgi:hypothetical protein
MLRALKEARQTTAKLPEQAGHSAPASFLNGFHHALHLTELF